MIKLLSRQGNVKADMLYEDNDLVGLKMDVETVTFPKKDGKEIRFLNKPYQH